jgi:hypothetical protein
LKGDHPANRRKFHEIWIEQCDAAQEIKLRYGLKAAFDYVVAEKLLNFAIPLTVILNCQPAAAIYRAR